MAALGKRAWVGGALGVALLASCNFSSLDELSIDNVDQADAELETTSHWMWSKYDSADNEALTELVGRLNLVVESARKNGDMPLQKRLSRLSLEEAAKVGLKDRDTAQAVGMMIASEVECSLDQIEHITISKQQKT